MSRPFLTIGMPSYNDYQGCYFTLQALRLYHCMVDIELLVVDTSPEHDPILEGLLIGDIGGRYVHAPELSGPAAAKDRVFQEASGRFVLCNDAHVMYQAGAIYRLIDYYQDNPETSDLICGPLLHDSLAGVSTHFVDQWNGTMWGRWALAWEKPDGTRFSPLEKDSLCQFVTLEINHRDISDQFPRLRYSRAYPGVLESLGCRRLGGNDDVFEIPGQGCGVLSCRKEAWLRFSPDWRGFGGEEMYLHDKYRRAGYKALCLGFLKWMHRFSQPDPVICPEKIWNMARNYVLGHLEQCRGLAQIEKNFVATGLMPRYQWLELLEDPRRAFPPSGLSGQHEAIKPLEASPERLAEMRISPEEIRGLLANIYGTAAPVDYV